MKKGKSLALVVALGVAIFGGIHLAEAPTQDASSRSSSTGDTYDRDLFGPAWTDTDRNGCDQRNDVLARDLRDVTFKPGTHDCVVLTGTLDDAYTGQGIAFVRGEDTSTAVQIDHVVPLSWAWQHGADSWDDARRVEFANDPANLQAVDGPTNASKSDQGPSSWLPPASSYHCTYVERFDTLVDAYDLIPSPADTAAIGRVSAACN